MRLLSKPILCFSREYTAAVKSTHLKKRSFSIGYWKCVLLSENKILFNYTILPSTSNRNKCLIIKSTKYYWDFSKCGATDWASIIEAQLPTDPARRAIIEPVTAHERPWTVEVVQYSTVTTVVPWGPRQLHCRGRNMIKLFNYISERFVTVTYV